MKWPKTLREALDRHRASEPDSRGCIAWAGAHVPAGYGILSFGGVRYYAHCAAYEVAYGSIPDGHEVDHRCLNPRCINPEHLRACTHKQNAEHRQGAYSNSLTGVRGITYDAKRRQYRARVKHNYREIHVGRFSTLAEAEAAVIAKRNELFTHNDLDREGGGA